MSHPFYVDNQLYFEFLQIPEHDLPLDGGRVNKQDLFKMVEASFRRLARIYHPQFGGSDKDFQFLMDSKSKIIESSNEMTGFKLTFDSQKFGTFDRNSLASQVGNQIFELISEWSTELNLKPIMRPKDEDDEYEWLFYSMDLDDQLCLNVQNLSHDLAELSHDLYQEDSLSVLVCLFVPSKKMVVTKVEYDNSKLLSFNDKIFIESSKASDIRKYFSSKENIKNDIDRVKSGEFISRKNEELKVKKSGDIIKRDREMIEKLANLKLFSTEFNPAAADFIDTL